MHTNATIDHHKDKEDHNNAAKFENDGLDHLEGGGGGGGREQRERIK